MDESRRERKKRQTRQLLVETALRLFDEQGYEQTTVAQIASAADVATKTFFNYFPSKEDVLFAESTAYQAIPIEVIADRREGESVSELLTRAYEKSIADYRAGGVGPRDREFMQIYVRLVSSVPSLQAKALHQAFETQKDVAAALVAAYPDELDLISASAVVGALAGATQAASLVCLEQGCSEDELWEAMRRALDIALNGLGA
ncbi:TetR family transcriptional regulator [Kutzneria albida]|uniref:HTH tetR-type domain-containing protein n=1 Tax=Kutzneria albida DSM 43870 TaxID=1449976 RepID=W5WGL6_9PSEU|nr:TetR family transcriptional regulator [Kutzneria albida]AHH99895.1 hypothetical protein KALB_6536 [Kutzneria albida DSM 43870]